MSASLESLQVGDTIAERTTELSRESLVRYAGASGDFNPIHYRDDIASAAGLDGVLAHGMLTMALAIAPLVESLPSPDRLRSYRARFSKPLYVPTFGTTVVTSTATVRSIDTDSRVAKVDIVVVGGGVPVLAKVIAEVAL